MSPTFSRWQSPLLPRVLMAVLVFLASNSLPAHAAPGDGHWDRQFGAPGTASRNFALRFNNNSLYTGGASLVAGQIATNTVVNVFDGSKWTSLGEITGGLTVLYDFGFWGNDLYVGGLFERAGDVPAAGLAKWDGANWSDVGGFSGLALSLATDGANLYVGGVFTNCGGLSITNVAKWNGANWSALGDGIGYYANDLSQVVNVLLWHNGQLYAGGAFTNAGAVAANNLARWDGNAWWALGEGVAGTGGGFIGSPVTALQFIGEDLYVGGKFTTVGGNVPALNIAKWNGDVWAALGAGLKASPNNTGPVTALASLGTDLYAFGSFTNAGGITAGGLARWNGDTWSAFGSLNGTRSRAVSHEDSIYVCGDFNIANFDTSSNVIGNHVIRWDGLNWHAVPGKPSNGTHLFVQAVTPGNDGLYVGGFFNAVGTTIARRIARWDGTSWFALGSGVDGLYNGNNLAVRAIKTRNNEVFVGGGFVSAGGATANNIARWDGENWSTLGYGVDSTVVAIETTPTDVYVGGSFTNAYDFPGLGSTVNRIARWSEASGWSPLGTGVSGTVNTIRAQDGLIYVGGSFTNAGGSPANRIAVWDASKWSALGTGSANGLNGTVNVILPDGSDIYVGGLFTTAGGVTARAIARWNGSSWSALGEGMFHTSTANVTGLAKIGGYLYASGVFTNAGGSVVTRNIARWDGSKWESLGSGIGNEATSGASRATALTVWGNDLFVGGIFETAGVCDAAYIARWNDQIDFTPPSVMRLSNPQLLPGKDFKFRATATESAAYVIEHSPNLLNWTPLTTNSLSRLDITNSVSGELIRSYRMREIP